ncbi:MAG: hypothetical protein ACI9UK_000400, partial [Candidatus Krumholzibacteriia bacterium]
MPLHKILGAFLFWDLIGWLNDGPLSVGASPLVFISKGISVLKSLAKKISGLILVSILALLPGELLAQDALSDSLLNLPCKDLEELFYRQIPRNVYDDLPDQVFGWVLRLDAECEMGEPMGRTQILASIWDGNFQEIVYGYQVISWLVDRYDPDKQAEPGSDRALFDTFTTDFSNQMLPHTLDGSLEQFYCLYYAGQVDEAWGLLQSEALEDTWLRYYYDEEVHNLSRADEPFLFGLHYGGWWPGGDIEFVGPKHIFGGSVSQNTHWGFWRFLIEWRGGRSDEPYFVDEEGVTGVSDRWDAILIGGEVGLTAWKSGSHQLDVFGGIGLDVVKPFRDEEVALAAFDLNLGTSYRFYLARSERFFLQADGRYEVIGSRNQDGDSL